MQLDARLMQYANSESQRKALGAVIDQGGYRPASRVTGISESTLRSRITAIKAEAARKGFAPDSGLISHVAEGFALKGYTLGVHPNGEHTVWYKASADAEYRQRALQAAADALAETLPKEVPVPMPAPGNADLLSCYVITDYHLGMLSWNKETGEDWDMQIAEDMLYRWFSAAIQSAPDSDTAVLAQLGDALHWDGLDAVTPANKNILDADTRFQKLVRVAIRAFRRIVRGLLDKHRFVRLIMAEGNHDPASSVWLREWMAAIYEDEPRVTVDVSADPYYCVEHGETSLFFHHGHLKKMTDVDTVFAGKFRDVFGRTKHSYAHLGHLHNQQVRETNLMIVEQHPTLAAKDAYASRHGYLSQRAASVISYHKTAGCVGRVTITPEMLGTVATG